MNNTERKALGICVKHGHTVCAECNEISDGARRMSDMINGMLTFHNPWEIRNKWMSFRLEDGRSDGVLYDTKPDAVRHAGIDEKYLAFFCFRNALGGANPRDCQIFLNMSRYAYESGMRIADPDDGPRPSRPDSRQLIVPISYYDAMMRIRRNEKPIHLDLDRRG